MHPEVCQTRIQEALLAGYRVVQPETRYPVFAFRLHQFISRGDTIYASLEDRARRYVTTPGQQFVPGDRDRLLLPLAFCRECGQEYYTVLRYIDPKTGDHQLPAARCHGPVGRRRRDRLASSIQTP